MHGPVICVSVHGPGLPQHPGPGDVDACVGGGELDPVAPGLCQPHEQVHWRPGATL